MRRRFAEARLTDRLSLTNALADADIERQKAERIATEIFDAIHDHVATKADLDRVHAGLKGDIAGLRTELKGDIAGLRTELKGDIAVAIAQLEHRLAMRGLRALAVLAGLIMAHQ